MANQKPWFLVMTPADANRPESQWVRQGAVSRGKISAMPIAPEGWIALVAFIVLMTGSALFIWWAFAAGGLSLAAALLFTIVVEAVLVGVFIMLERFPAKWEPVRRRKRDNEKNLDHDPIQSDRIMV